MFIEPVAFIILLLLGLVVIYLYVVIARLPGQKARERGHPQADAINILGWIGPFLGAIGWVIALIWAYTNPPRVVVVTRDASPAEVGQAVEEALEAGE
jgi:uncharacterized BrkB/YihY/UPF0761 family membrane protein